MRHESRIIVLGLALIVTALSVVYVRHDARRGFVALQTLETERDELVTDWGRLQLEYATWAEGSRVDALARQRLDLHEAKPRQVMVIVE